MHIFAINIYPIKSLAGIGVDSAVVEERGLQFDRRWMLTDMQNTFMTQREFPKMATIRVQIADEKIIVSNEKLGEMSIPVKPETGDVRNVTIWLSTCPAEVYNEQINSWFSKVLETECQLVYMPDDTRRNVNPLFNENDDVVSFADGYPLMVLSEASVANLNARIADSEEHAGRLPAVRPLPMNRFRPNLVVSGAEAFAEDNWKTIRIGDAVFRSTKPSERCVITTVDQAKGEVAGKEPLKTLASYRMAKNVIPERFESLGIPANAVLFGQNLIPESVGATIHVSDKVEIISA